MELEIVSLASVLLKYCFSHLASVPQNETSVCRLNGCGLYGLETIMTISMMMLLRVRSVVIVLTKAIKRKFTQPLKRIVS